MSSGNEWSGPDELSLERGDLCYGYQFLWNFASDKRLRTRLFDALYWDLYDKETLEEWYSENAHFKRWYKAQRKFWKLYEAPSNKEWNWDTIPLPDDFKSMARRSTRSRNIDGEHADTLDPLGQHPIEEDPEQTPERDLIAALLHEVQCLKERVQVGKVWNAVLYRRERPLGPRTWKYYDRGTIGNEGLDDDDGDDEYAGLYEDPNTEESNDGYSTEYDEREVDEYTSGHSEGYTESYEQSNVEVGDIEYSTEYYDGELDEYASDYSDGSKGFEHVTIRPGYENDKDSYSNDEKTGLPRNTQEIIDNDPEPADTMTITTRCRNILFLRGTSRILNPRNEGGAHAKRRDLFMIEYLSGAGIILNEPNQYGIVCVHIKGSRDARYRARYYLDEYVRCLRRHEDAHRESDVEVLTQWDDDRGVGEYRSASRGRTMIREAW